MVLTGAEGHTSGISVNDITAYSVSFVWPYFLCARMGNPIFGITFPLPNYPELVNSFQLHCIQSNQLIEVSNTSALHCAHIKTSPNTARSV